jgi:hypothetical protein
VTSVIGRPDAPYPATYSRHLLHHHERTWPETNCYVDLWIELLHSRGLDPRAALPFVFGTDFVGDQWTFIKYPLGDLQRAYGIEVFELNVWRDLIVHIREHVAQGRVALVEVDAFYLPDTHGTSYRTQHVKTTIAVQQIDARARQLGYFHNAGYYELGGDDFAALFRPALAPAVGYLPPYVEIARLPLAPRHEGRKLVEVSLDLLQHQLTFLPDSNPFRRYRERIGDELDALRSASADQFHAYAFATFRQCGAAFELGGTYLRWLGENGERGLIPAAVACEEIATHAKTLQMKAARLVSARRCFDPMPHVDAMARARDEIVQQLTGSYLTSHRQV